MAEVTKPIALDESFNTTEATPRNIADVLAAGLSSANELSDLDDVTINTSTLENRQGLIYNSTTDTWTNGTVATSIDCTQAQYDAWKSTGQLVVGTTYMIKDGQNVTCDLGDLDDVTISGSPSGKVLMNNGSAWVDSAIGTITEGTISGSTNCTNGNSTEVGSITLNKGTYVIVAGIDWAPSGSGYRQVALATGNNPARDSAVTFSSCGAGKDDYNQITALKNITADNTSIKVYGLQTSGGTLVAYPYIRAIKIG